MLEIGHGVAGFASGNFYGEPSPVVTMYAPGRRWHWGKVLFEQWWLAPPGMRREALRLALVLGPRVLRIPPVV
jgi:hypothetical protein